ncbi:MAG: response regulator transcription factor [Cytophagaceae bacterium]|nr:response regulator transcription factor [Cytophagaceae bacterium]MBK9509576.1 response regulator transcription factor [Cytophagaceae bacterium]MBK9936157.1 response regulator transcription factor [Cytophagaceae bacterium]MBL0303956.1 response regulator transcription factor [Cytophagaceae bacterium]MBL0326769.1 response regulator transcription factor [Cytophagaceae bacterium]
MSETKRILIIEDDVRIAQNISKGLVEKGYETEVAYDGKIGLKLGLHNDFDLILLDLNLPSLNGYEVCEEIRRKKPVIPIIMLTALGETEDKIEGFEKGADDYLVKPFDFRELLARINVFIKRNARSIEPDNNNVLKIANLELDPESKIVTRDGIEIELTPKEFLLLEYLMRNKGKVVSKTDLADNIWEQNSQQSLNVIEVYINFLRKKIDKEFIPKLIHTKTGMGYILKEEV